MRRLQRVSGEHTIARAANAGTGKKRYIAAAAVVLLSAGTLCYKRAHSQPILTDRDVVVVADFKNATGDSVFDITLKEALAAQLQNSALILPNAPRRAVEGHDIIAGGISGIQQGLDMNRRSQFEAAVPSWSGPYGWTRTSRRHTTFSAWSTAILAKINSPNL